MDGSQSDRLDAFAVLCWCVSRHRYVKLGNNLCVLEGVVRCLEGLCNVFGRVL